MKLGLPQIMVMLLYCIATPIIAQNSTDLEPLPLVEYKSNVNAPITVQERALLVEVFGDQLNTRVMARPNYLRALKDILRNRVQIVQYNQPENYKVTANLSEVSLFDYYVPNLKRDVAFNTKTFNPLKYNFDFFKRGASIYRVDGTNYFILIKSQHH